MVSTYKNPTRIVRKVEEVSTAWERIAPKAEFGGMTLADFKAAVGDSFATRSRAAELEAELSANIPPRRGRHRYQREGQTRCELGERPPHLRRKQRPLPRHGLCDRR